MDIKIKFTIKIRWLISMLLSLLISSFLSNPAMAIDFGENNSAMVINSIERDWKGYKYSWDAPSEGKEYVKIIMTFENNEKDSLYISKYNLFLKDIYGKESKGETFIQGLDNPLISQNLSSESSKTGSIVFEVTKGVSLKEIIYDLKNVVINISPQETIPVENILLDKLTLELKKGETENINVSFYPENAANQNVLWSSEDTSIATVENGKITAVGEGYTIITCTSLDGDKKAYCYVNIASDIEISVPVTNITLDKNFLEMEKKEKQTLTATITPDDASNKKVIWRSSDFYTASVDSNGKITAKKEGTAIITATTEDGNYTVSCEVKVKPTLLEIKANFEKIKIKQSETDNIIITAYYSDNTTVDVTNDILWEVENPQIVLVNKGQVQGLIVGNTNIKASYKDKSIDILAEVRIKGLVEVEFGKKNQSIFRINSIERNWDEYQYDWNKPSENKEYVKMNITFENNEESDLIYIESYGITVKDIYGKESQAKTLVLGLKDSLPIGNVKPNNFKTGSIIFEVDKGTTLKEISYSRENLLMDISSVSQGMISIENIYLNKSSLTLKENQTYILTVEFYPKDASNKSIIWSSENLEIAYVKDGIVTALKEGTTKINVVSLDGGKSASCEVKVERQDDNSIPVNDVLLDKTTLTLIEGEEYILTASIIPEDATNNNLKWTTSNFNIASVEDNGKIIAKKSGNAVVTVTTEDGGYSKNCEITVKPTLVKIEAEKENIKVKEGQSEDIRIKVYYSDESSEFLTEGIIWDSKNKDIAAVNNGKIEGLSIGETIITAEYKGKKISIPVIVRAYNKIEETFGEDNNYYLYVNSIERNWLDYGYAYNAPKEGKEYVKIKMTFENDGKYDSFYVSKYDIFLKDDNGNEIRGETFFSKLKDGLIGGTVNPQKFITGSMIFEVDKDVTLSQLIYKKENIELDIKFFSKGYIPVESIALNKKNASLYVGESEELIVAFSPQNSLNKNIIWTSSDENVLKVENGKMYALSSGNSIVSAQSEDGHKETACSVTVILKELIQLAANKTQVELNSVENKVNITLKAFYSTNEEEEVNPENIVWLSRNEEIALVTKGQIKAVSEGNTIIEAEYKGTKVLINVSVVTPTDYNNLYEKTYFFLDLFSDADEINSVLEVYSTKELIVTFDKKYITKIYTECDDGKLTYLKVEVDDNVGSVQAKINGIVKVLKKDTSNIFSIEIVGLEKGADIIVDVLDDKNEKLESKAFKLKNGINLIEQKTNASLKDKYTLYEISNSKSLFEKILQSVPLNEIKINLPVRYIKKVDINYNDFSTTVKVELNERVDKAVCFISNSQQYEMELQSDGSYQYVLFDFKKGKDITIKVYDDKDYLLQQKIVK